MQNIPPHEMASSIFLKAVGYVRTYGWQVVGMAEHGQPRCSMGALASAHPEPVWDKALSSVMYETLYETLVELSFSEFNRKVKNNQDVIDLFEKMAGLVLKKSDILKPSQEENKTLFYEGL